MVFVMNIQPFDEMHMEVISLKLIMITHIYKLIIIIYIAVCNCQDGIRIAQLVYTYDDHVHADVRVFLAQQLF